MRFLRQLPLKSKIMIITKNFLERIINSISDPIFVKDRQHRGVLVNDAFCKLMACRREDLLGKSDRDHECFAAGEADVFRASDELVFSTGKENINEEVLTATDGKVHLIVTKKTLYTDEKGEQFIVGVIQDVTERQRVEAALRESEANYYSLVDQMPAGIFRKDKEGRYVFVNAAFCRMKGRPPENFLGKTALELEPEEAAWAASRASHHAQIMQTGQPVELEEQHRRADGRTLFFHVVKTPVFNSEGDYRHTRSPA